MGLETSCLVQPGPRPQGEGLKGKRKVKTCEKRCFFLVFFFGGELCSKVSIFFLLTTEFLLIFFGDPFGKVATPLRDASSLATAA